MACVVPVATEFAPLSLEIAASNGAVPGTETCKMKNVGSNCSLSSLATQLPDDNDGDLILESWDESVDVPGTVSKPRHSESGETLIFLDWDDTLFPTTELFVRKKMLEDGNEALSSALDSALGPWRTAMHEFLVAACSVADRCVILTNASKGWVEKCVCRFVPEVEHLLSSGRIKVVYSADALRRQTLESWSNRAGSCIAGLKVLWASIYEWDENDLDTTERDALRTRKKAAGMALEGASYYRGRQWENVLSFGDASYERDAVRALASTSHGQVAKTSRAKDIMVPPAASLEVMVRTLRLSTQFLHQLVDYDGCLSVDLAQEQSLEMLS